MGFRFRKSVKIAPGIKLNLGKKSASVSFGGKGARYTVSSTGRKTASVGIPGTGISYSEQNGGKSSESSNKPVPQYRYQSSNSGGGRNGGCLFTVLKFLLILMVWPFYLSYWFWKTDKVTLSKKARVGVIAAGWILLMVLLPSGGGKETEQMPSPTEQPLISSTSTPEPTAEPTAEPAAEPTPEPTPEPTVEPSPAPTEQAPQEEKVQMVWIPTNGGTKYHNRSGCSNMKNPKEVTLDYATSHGYTKCSKC